MQGLHSLPESLGGRRGYTDGCSFTGLPASLPEASRVLGPYAAAGTRKAALARTVKKANYSSAGQFWGPPGFLRASCLVGRRSPRRALGGGLRIAAAAAEGEEPCADCPGAENEHGTVGPSLEGVPNALWGMGKRHKHRAGGSETQPWGFSGLL